MTRQAVFCNKCGAPFVEPALYCSKCGGPRTVLSAPDAESAAQQAVVPQTGVTAAAVSSVASLGRVAGVGALAMALPWQTIVAGETPDPRAMFSSAVVPGARRAVQASLRKPGLSLAATTVLDLVVAALSGGTGALAAALPRAAVAGVSALLALVTGRKSGALRTLTGVLSLITALVQVASLLMTLVGGVTAGSALLSLVPMAIATGSALVMAVKTASVALRRRP